MNFVMKMVEQIMELFRKTKQRKRAVSVIAALVLIVSTIAPAASAFAVEENTASTQAYSEEIAEEVEPEENDETVDNETGDDLLSVDTEESEADIESEEAGQEESADAGETSDDTADMDDQAIEEMQLIRQLQEQVKRLRERPHRKPRRLLNPQGLCSKLKTIRCMRILTNPPGSLRE